MPKVNYPEAGKAVQVGPDQDGTDFERVEGNWIDDESSSNMALACKRLGVTHLRVAPDAVACTGGRFLGCDEYTLLNAIEKQFGFRPTKAAIQSYYRSITEWGSPNFRRAMSWSDS